MLKKILFGIGIVVAAVMLLLALQPAKYEVKRQITINAPAEKIFPFLNSSMKSQEWMPWKDGDSQMRLEFTGPDSGVGSSAKWDSPGSMGSGESVIIESVNNSKVVTELNYLKPIAMSQIAVMSLSPANNNMTTVTWSVSGRNSVMSRAMSVFRVMDSMIGKEFEKGLARLKSSVEASSPPKTK